MTLDIESELTADVTYSSGTPKLEGNKEKAHVDHVFFETDRLMNDWFSEDLLQVILPMGKLQVELSKSYATASTTWATSNGADFAYEYQKDYAPGHPEASIVARRILHTKGQQVQFGYTQETGNGPTTRVVEKKTMLIKVDDENNSVMELKQVDQQIAMEFRGRSTESSKEVFAAIFPELEVEKLEANDAAYITNQFENMAAIMIFG